jgi:beta-N-acetylhexosaminidase
MLCCGKHFPGLGPSVIDPHSELPVVDIDLQEVWDTDLKPFRDMALKGIPAVMTTHAIFRSVDPFLPGTISSRVVDLLKRDVAFKGLTLTDDLEMGAIAGVFPPGRTAWESVAAGHDLVLVCRNPGNIEAAYEGLFRAVKDYNLLPSRLRDARMRLNRTLKMIS